MTLTGARGGHSNRKVELNRTGSFLTNIFIYFKKSKTEFKTEPNRF